MCGVGDPHALMTNGPGLVYMLGTDPYDVCTAYTSPSSLIHCSNKQALVMLSLTYFLQHSLKTT